MNWNWLRSFLAVAEEGSLSAAARRLGITQPTVGRHVDDLEDALDVGLFDRHSRGLRLTKEGADLVEPAREMAAAADALRRRAAGQDTALEGPVRISANDVMAVEVLPRAFAAFRERYPGIRIELVVTNEVSSLSRRDADLAVRLVRPSQVDLVARRIADLPLGFYAHRDWLDRRGPIAPDTPLDGVDLIGFDEDRVFLDGARRLGHELTERDFVYRCDTIITHAQMARAGLGVAVLHDGVARRDPALVRVFDWVRLPPLELWLVCHRDVQHNRRIRAAMDFLGRWLAADPYDGPGAHGQRRASGGP